MRILIAEDHQQIANQVSSALRAEGRAVDIAQDGLEARHLAETEPYDLIILDLGLPEVDGLTVLQRLRAKGNTVPVLILTARDGWSDRVDGLDAGADDYLVKPFRMEELLARVRAMLRRVNGHATPVLLTGSISFDTRSNQVMRDGVEVFLTSQETMVLSYLLHNAGRIVSQSELSDHIYKFDGDRDSNTIAVFINRLRRKLGKDLIQTLRGQGYRIDGK